MQEGVGLSPDLGKQPSFSPGSLLNPTPAVTVTTLCSPRRAFGDGTFSSPGDSPGLTPETGARWQAWLDPHLRCPLRQCPPDRGGSVCFPVPCAAAPGGGSRVETPRRSREQESSVDGSAGLAHTQTAASCRGADPCPAPTPPSSAPLFQSAAKMIKETMDKKFGSSWHVVIGEGFGFEITHEVKNLLYLYFGGTLAVCVWKCS